MKSCFVSSPLDLRTSFLEPTQTTKLPALKFCLIHPILCFLIASIYMILCGSNVINYDEFILFIDGRILCGTGMINFAFIANQVHSNMNVQKSFRNVHAIIFILFTISIQK